jgi:23S rRNA pseudouridine1911/1915/1917 synthase
MEWTVDADKAGCRLDAWLAASDSSLSRSRWQELIKAGRVLVDGVRRNASHSVRCGARISAEIPEPVPVTLRPESIPIEILYEDKDIVVINKQAGLVVHPSAGHSTGTLVHALLHHCGDLAGIGGELRPGIVHRLDKDTSGVMVAVKTDKAMQSIAAQFKSGGIKKEYMVVVRGCPSPAQGIISTRIGRDPRNRKRMAVCASGGKEAESAYQVEERLGAYSILRVRIKTGRTHQIRVHMAHLGCPVAGDRQYGGRRFGAAKAGADQAGIPCRQMLHAFKLGLNLPSNNERMEFTAPLPDDMNSFIARIRAESASAGA